MYSIHAISVVHGMLENLGRISLYWVSARIKVALGDIQADTCTNFLYSHVHYYMEGVEDMVVRVALSDFPCIAHQKQAAL